MKLIFLALLLISTATASARQLAEQEPQPVEIVGMANGDLRRDLLNDLQRLSSKGFNGVYCREGQDRGIGLKRLTAVARSFRLITLPEFAKPAGATRWSAFTSRNERTIYLNSESEGTRRSRRVIALHELLNMAAFPDEDYQTSILMALLIEESLHGVERALPPEMVLYELENRNCSHLDPLRDAKRYIENAPDRVLRHEDVAGAGGDTVGNAGDMAYVELKLRLLEKVVELHREQSRPLLALILNLKLTLNLQLVNESRSCLPDIKVMHDELHASVPRVCVDPAIRLSLKRSDSVTASIIAELFKISALAVLD